MSSRAFFAAALGVGAAASAVVWAAAAAGPAVPLGALLLGLAVVLALSGQHRWTTAAAVGLASLVLIQALAAGAGQTAGSDGWVVAVGRVVQLASTLTAVATGCSLVVRSHRAAPRVAPSRRARARAQRVRRRPALAPVATLMLLAPIGAELLAAYGDSTGRPGAVAFALVFFAALYGCPALLAREVAIRTGRGWPAILLFAAALAVLEAGVVDQSVFAEESDLVRGWDESVRRTYVDPLGISAFNALSWVIGHVVYSFAAPIAVAQAIRPGLAWRPWLGRRALVGVTLLWLAAAAVIVADLEPGAVHSGTPVEIAAAAVIAAGLVAAAFLTSRRTEPRSGTPSMAGIRAAGVGGFVVATALALPPDTWLGVVLLVAAAMVSAVWLARVARAGRWGLAHTAAAGTGALVSRGTLAFLYQPLVGEVAEPAKYTHNVVMLVTVTALGVYAVRQASAWAVPPPDAQSPDGQALETPAGTRERLASASHR